MIDFRMPCNWDSKLLDAVAGSPVTSFFGMVPSHVAGGGRPTAAVPKIDPAGARAYIQAVRAKGYSFNYLFNAPCLDAKEFTATWREEFVRHLDWAVESGADWATVTVPYLIEVIKKRHPALKVSVSSYARVNSLRRAVYFQELGADDITLDPISMTRNFRGLEAMTKTLRCSVTLIANGDCLYQCPFAEYHAVLMGHSSQDNHASGGYYEEYPFYNCSVRKLRDPAEIVRSGFIRPEDLGLYAEVGVTHFKLVDRGRPTAWLASVLKAYAQGRYDGDLLQILNFPHFFLGWVYQQAGNKDRPLFPTVDNRALDGFIETLRKIDCVNRDCDSCGVCREYAGRAVKKPEGVAKMVAALDSTLAKLQFT